MKTLNREAIQRMVGVTGGSAGGVGGGGGGSVDLTGYATESWVDERYLSIEFFSSLFKAYDSASTPNEIVPNGGDTTAITNIKAMFGFWTDQYLSALGQNSGGGGGGSSTLAGLNDVQLGTLAANDVLTYDGSGHWVNTPKSTLLSGYATQSWVTGMALNGYATQTWVGQQGFLTSVAFADLTSHPTTLSGYGITDAKFGTANNDKRPITLGSVTQDVLIAHQSLSGYATESWVTGTALSGYATQQWVGQQGFLTSVAFSDLTSHPTTLSGYGITDAYSKTDADGRFLTISFFRSLFRAYNSSSVEVVPNSGDTTTIDNIKAMFGFWTDQYLSALGQNLSGGGGGGSSTLAGLNDVQLGTLAANDVLTYDGSGHWVNTPKTTLLSGYATQSWVTGTALSGYATQSWVQNQGYLTSSAISDMATKTWVGQQGYLTSVAFGDLTSHPTTLSGYGITDAIANNTTFWGQTVTNGAVTGSLANVHDISTGNNGGTISGFHGIELNTHGSLSGYGGYIDFHYDGSVSDYTVRLVEESAGVLRLYGQLRIGDAFISWDSTNNCLKITGGVYSTSFVSALGINSN